MFTFIRKQKISSLSKKKKKSYENLFISLLMQVVMSIQKKKK